MIEQVEKEMKENGDERRKEMSRQEHARNNLEKILVDPNNKWITNEREFFG